MEKEYSQEQLWKLYEKLPEQLKDIIFSEETANDIGDICTRNGIEAERTSEIARLVGQVFLGLIPPGELQDALEKEAKLSPEKAKKISSEVARFIFSSVKYSLAELYKEITPPAKPGEKPALSKEDVYRESIE